MIYQQCVGHRPVASKPTYDTDELESVEILNFKIPLDVYLGFLIFCIICTSTSHRPYIDPTSTLHGPYITPTCRRKKYKCFQTIYSRSFMIELSKCQYAL